MLRNKKKFVLVSVNNNLKSSLTSQVKTCSELKKDSMKSTMLITHSKNKIKIHTLLKFIISN
jgi:hypothetical protein